MGQVNAPAVTPMWNADLFVDSFNQFFIGTRFQFFGVSIAVFIQFVKNLNNQFNAEQCQRILNYLKDPQLQLDDDLVDEYNEWFEEYFQDNAKNILSIGWDCYRGGSPMSNGGAWYGILHGLVRVGSSDESPEIQVFSRKQFYPWLPEWLCTDMIEMSSDYFSTEELLSFMAGLIVWENECTSDVYINDVAYSVDYESKTIFPSPSDLE